MTSTIFMVLALSFSGPAVAGAAPDSGKIALPNEDQTQSISKPVLDKFASAKPWTAERMKKAILADEPEASAAVPLSLAEAQDNVSKDKEKKATKATEPVAPLNNPDQPGLLAATAVPSTAGKLFYYNPYDGRDYVCSGSVINSNHKNLVITAAHCVHGGPGSGFFKEFAFAPAYFNGPNSYYGVWHYEMARTFNSWINSSDWSHDQAFVSFQPRNGQELVNVTGGNGLVTGNSRTQSNTRIWGWPAGAPYTGEVPYYCDGTSEAFAFSSTDSALYCDMTGGASGGPWLKDIINYNLGYVYAVTSRRMPVGRPLLLATPNSSDVLSMFNLMY
ncbi:trypsin-like serine peptidase [Pseudarthrobacter cellobiosi]|uniref:trypsin-like serine peptidase n=1 Tax=Pseudarthrobacter cellobiosi TaxID=2953654 RepID=UPI00208F3ED3|nr:trypsin-like peptidase domain-containing protein [Pseudarthrobacter sp. HLT1-5]MCO4253879.1 trypsin-like peptidase domain-containing protein [Pseudarthrobacter sp. HLT1-5]